MRVRKPELSRLASADMLRRLGRIVVAAGWVVLTLLIAAAALRTLAPTADRWLILLAALTPFVYLPAWLCLAIAAVARRWRMLLVALILVAAHVWWVAPLFIAGRGGLPEAQATATVLTINLHADQPTGAAAARMIAAARPDVVVLSEASPVSTAGLHVPGLPVAAEDVRSGTTGWMVLSHWPVLSVQQVNLEDRVMPRLVLRRPDGGDLVVWQVHPVAPVAGYISEWHRELSAIRRAIAPDLRSPDPVVVAGDFNSTRDLPPFHALLDDGWADASDGHGLMATWRVGGRLPPLLRLDHVLVGRGVGVRSVRRTRSIGSDHLGLIAEVEFGAAHER